MCFPIRNMQTESYRPPTPLIIALYHRRLKLRYLDCDHISIQTPTNMGTEERTYPNEQKDQVTRNKSRKNPQIPPPVIIFQPERPIKLITNPIRAVLARIRDIFRKISWPSTFEEVAHILPAALPRRRRESVVLDRRAFHRPVVQFRHNHPAHQPRERVELVKPRTPEAWDLRFRDRNAAEEGEGDDEKRVEERADEAAWRQRRDQLAESDGEQLRYEDDEELVACFAGGGLEAGEVVERDEEADGAEDAVGHFGKDH